MSDVVTHAPGFRLLWADADVKVCASVRTMLAGSFELDLAGDADAALELARRHQPALVCVAANLRTADGAPLLRALRSEPALHATTLVLSCPRGEEVALSDELLACADDLFLTPFSARELTARLHAHVRRWSARSDERADITFLSSLGHELRTPLTAILLWAGSLRGGAASEPELERALRCIAASAQAQSRRIDDLLDLSRLAAGRLVLSPRQTCMSSLLRSVWGELWPLAAAKGMALALELAEPLGEAEVDAARMRQVVSNLLSNAIKFTPQGGTVRLLARRRDQEIEVEVSDSGEGIAHELMPRLFQRFQQGREGEQRQPGLGIGLALSRQLVQLQGGSVEAYSAGPGQGATFRVRLPVPSAAQAQLSKTRTERGAAAKLLRGRTILLVEDHDETREAMQFVLERAGGCVLAVDSAVRALALLGAGAEPADDAKSAAIDVIVCDLGLPEVSGLEFVSRLLDQCRHERRSPPPACAVSAHARDVDRQRAIEAGFDLHLAKPVTAVNLIEAVDDLCQITRTQPAEASASTYPA